MFSVQIAMIAGLPCAAFPMPSSLPLRGSAHCSRPEPSTVNVKVDENKIVSDVRDEAHLNARRATRGK